MFPPGLWAQTRPPGACRCHCVQARLHGPALHTGSVALAGCQHAWKDLIKKTLILKLTLGLVLFKSMNKLSAL